jgi:hypothetical protein
MTWWKWPCILEYWLWCVRKCGVCSGQHCCRLIITCSITFSSHAGRIQMSLSKLLWALHLNEHLSCLLWVKIQSDSYNTKVIFAWMVRSGWNLLQKHCVFMLVLRLSNLQQPEQMGLSGTRYCMGLSCTALWEQHVILCGHFDCQTWNLQVIFSGAAWRNEYTGINLLPCDLCKTTSDLGLPT